VNPAAPRAGQTKTKSAGSSFVRSSTSSAVRPTNSKVTAPSVSVSRPKASPTTRSTKESAVASSMRISSKRRRQSSITWVEVTAASPTKVSRPPSPSRKLRPSPPTSSSSPSTPLRSSRPLVATLERVVPVLALDPVVAGRAVGDVVSGAELGLFVAIAGGHDIVADAPEDEPVVAGEQRVVQLQPVGGGTADRRDHVLGRDVELHLEPAGRARLLAAGEAALDRRLDRLSVDVELAVAQALAFPGADGAVGALRLPLGPRRALHLPEIGVSRQTQAVVDEVGEVEAEIEIGEKPETHGGTALSGD
jgi:hypothetical protein